MFLNSLFNWLRMYLFFLVVFQTPVPVTQIDSKIFSKKCFTVKKNFFLKENIFFFKKTKLLFIGVDNFFLCKKFFCQKLSVRQTLGFQKRMLSVLLLNNHWAANSPSPRYCGILKEISKAEDVNYI